MGDANVVKQTPMQLQSQKPMPGMAMDTIHTTGTTILAKEKLKLKLSHNHGMDIEDMEVIMVAGVDANAVKPKLTHGEDTVGVDMDMEDIMVKFVYHGSDIYEMITTSSWIYPNSVRAFNVQTIDSFWHP